MAERIVQTVERGQDMVFHHQPRGNMHRGGIDVVRALGAVDVVVRVNAFFAQRRVCARGDDLVDVHVRLRAAARLPDDKRELRVQLTGAHLARGCGNGIRKTFVHRAKAGVHVRGRLFHSGERMDDLRRHFFRADAEVFIAALGLRAPELISRHAHLAHRVVFDAIFHYAVSLH